MNERSVIFHVCSDFLFLSHFGQPSAVFTESTFYTTPTKIPFQTLEKLGISLKCQQLSIYYYKAAIRPGTSIPLTKCFINNPSLQTIQIHTRSLLLLSEYQAPPLPLIPSLPPYAHPGPKMPFGPTALPRTREASRWLMYSLCTSECTGVQRAEAPSCPCSLPSRQHCLPPTTASDCALLLFI